MEWCGIAGSSDGVSACCVGGLVLSCSSWGGGGGQVSFGEEQEGGREMNGGVNFSLCSEAEIGKRKKMKSCTLLLLLHPFSGWRAGVNWKERHHPGSRRTPHRPLVPHPAEPRRRRRRKGRIKTWKS